MQKQPNWMINKKNTENKRCLVVCPNPSVDILAHIPAIKASASNRIKSEKRYPGGKGIHVAMALCELNIPTTLVGFWGDKNGNWLIDACKDYYPELEVIGPKLEGWNRSCYTFQSTLEWQDTEILGTGPTMNEDNFQELIKLIMDRKEEIQSIAVCGSWVVGALPHYNQKIVEMGNSLNIPVFLDCTGAQLKNALLSRPYCIHLNKNEVTEYMNDTFDNAKQKMSNLCEIAAITDGSKGLYLYINGEEIHTTVKIENVKSTVGSGDCLMAGIIAGSYLRISNQEIARLGAACGAANCLNEDLGMLKKEDVEQLFFKMNNATLTF